MTNRSDFLQAARRCEWHSLLEIIGRGDADLSIPSPSASVLTWLLELDAPAGVVVSFVRKLTDDKGVDPNALGLLEACLDLSETTSNAFATFSSLLDIGLSPNVIASDGSTLFQKALERGRSKAVGELLRHGVDPCQMSVFGAESTTNFDEAVEADNAAGRLALAFWKTEIPDLAQVNQVRRQEWMRVWLGGDAQT